MDIKAKPTLTPHQQAMRDLLEEASNPLVVSDATTVLGQAVNEWLQQVHALNGGMSRGTMMMIRVMIIHSFTQATIQYFADKGNEPMPDAAAVVHDLIKHPPLTYNVYLEDAPRD